MSLKISIITSQKKQLAAVIREIAQLISISSNDRVSLELEVNFNPKEASQ